MIPVEKTAGRKNLYFNPRPRNRSPWDKYREAWCQMAYPNEETGPSKIVATRCLNNEDNQSMRPRSARLSSQCEQGVRYAVTNGFTTRTPSTSRVCKSSVSKTLHPA